MLISAFHVLSLLLFGAASCRPNKGFLTSHSEIVGFVISAGEISKEWLFGQGKENKTSL